MRYKDKGHSLIFARISQARDRFKNTRFTSNGVVYKGVKNNRGIRERTIKKWR